MHFVFQCEGTALCINSFRVIFLDRGCFAGRRDVASVSSGSVSLRHEQTGISGKMSIPAHALL